MGDRFQYFPLLGSMAILLVGGGCTTEFTSTIVPRIILEPLAAFPGTMAHTDTARVQVRLRADDRRSSEVVSARVTWASERSGVVSVVQDTVPTGSDTFEVRAAGLSATLKARRRGSAVITVRITDGTGIAKPVTLTHIIAVKERWIAVSAGARHSCGISIDSVAYCWGGSGGCSETATVPKGWFRGRSAA